MPTELDAPVGLVNVLPDREVKGIESLDVRDARRRGRVMTLEEAIYLEHDSDAHIVPVLPTGWSGETCPRLKKGIVHDIRDRGRDLVLTALFYDLDNDEHSPHDVDTFTTFQDLVRGLPDHLKPTANYATKRGWRLVYKLKTPVPVEDGECLHKGFAQVLQNVGLPIDEACASDWTHLYRAPNVVRDDEPSWESEFSHVHCNGKAIDPDGLPRRGTKRTENRVAHVQGWDGDRPEPEDVQRMVGYNFETDLARAAKKAFHGKSSFAVIFEDRPIGTPGTRDNQMFGIVRQVFELLFDNYPDLATPDNVFALLYKPATALSGDEELELGKLWDKATREWQYQTGKRVAIKADNNRVLTKMRELYDLPEDEDEALEEILSRCMLVKGREIWILDSTTGYYSPTGYSPLTLANGIKRSGMSGVLHYRQRSKNGKETIRPLAEIFEDYSLTVSRIRYQATDSPTPGGWIEDDDVLVFPAYWLRTNLGAAFNERVDEYYRALFGKNFELAMAWIAGALSINAGPISAMLLHGPPGIGKGMFVQGLAECFSKAVVVDGHAESGDYQTGAEINSPIICYDEALPNVSDFSVMFRRNVAGGTRTINEKYQAQREITSYPRYIITANNDETLHDIAARSRMMSDADAAAVAQRLLILYGSGKAARLLRDRGGWRYTAGWAKSPSCESEQILARHNLWVWENMRRAPDSRFLVEGNAAELVRKEMALRNVVAADVLKALVRMLEESKRPSMGSRTHIAKKGRKLYITTNAIVAYIEKNRGSYQKLVNEKSVAQVLRVNHATQSENAIRRRTLRNTIKRARWWKLDVPYLVAYAEDVGLDCEHLASLVE